MTTPTPTQLRALAEHITTDGVVLVQDTADELAAREREWKRSLDLANAIIAGHVGRLKKIGAAAEIGADVEHVAGPIAAKPPMAPVHGAARARADATPPSTMKRSGGAGQRLLDAAAWWHAIGVDRPTRLQLGFVAGIKPTGGYFSNTIGPLFTGGLLARDGDGVSLTAAGDAAANHPPSAPSLEAYHEMIRGVIGSGATLRILDAVIDRGGAPVSCEDIGTTTGIETTGGYFSNSIGPLSTLGLIERRNGVVTPTALLFPAALGGGAR